MEKNVVINRHQSKLGPNSQKKRKEKKRKEKNKTKQNKTKQNKTQHFSETIF